MNRRMYWLEVGTLVAILDIVAAAVAIEHQSPFLGLLTYVLMAPTLMCVAAFLEPQFQRRARAILRFVLFLPV